MFIHRERRSELVVGFEISETVITVYVDRLERRGHLAVEPSSAEDDKRGDRDGSNENHDHGDGDADGHRDRNRHVVARARLRADEKAEIGKMVARAIDDYATARFVGAGLHEATSTAAPLGTAVGQRSVVRVKEGADIYHTSMGREREVSHPSIQRGHIGAKGVQSYLELSPVKGESSLTGMEMRISSSKFDTSRAPSPALLMATRPYTCDPRALPCALIGARGKGERE